MATSIAKVLTIEAKLTQTNIVLPCKFEMAQGGRLLEYDGDYEVTPSLKKQTLKTENRSTLEDIIVRAVPVERIENEYGTTVIICGTEEVINKELGEIEDNG